MAFYVTVSSRSFVKQFPNNSAQRFCHLLDTPLDLRSNYEVGIMEQYVLIRPSAETSTKPHPLVRITSPNLVHSRRYEEEYQPILQIGRLSISHDNVEYIPCVKSIFTELFFDITPLQPPKVPDDMHRLMTLHFRPYDSTAHRIA